VTISNETRGRVKKIGEPIALFFGRLGLTPDGLTLIGFGITTAGAILLAFGLWIPGALVVFFGGVFDMFDGTLARATGRVSKLGAFMDSVFDRWGEALVYVGLIIGTSRAGFDLGTWLAGAAMAAAFLVSYARAKSEGLGFSAGTGMAEVGLMPREIRLVVLTLGLLAAGLAGGVVPVNLFGESSGSAPTGAGTAGSLLLALALGIIAILGTITVIQRVVQTRSQAGNPAPGQDAAAVIPGDSTTSRSNP
jgi:CDP-diacylglycerol--glycerol-3-phosphate 3-phosphatidyltransferase